jgi:hypothetical protein
VEARTIDVFVAVTLYKYQDRAEQTMINKAKWLIMTLTDEYQQGAGNRRDDKDKRKANDSLSYTVTRPISGQ